MRQRSYIQISIKSGIINLSLYSLPIMNLHLIIIIVNNYDSYYILYILTTGDTYSAAENFTDILQKRNRVTVVGETTRGGAHSTGGPRVLNDYFIVKMPNAININPITKSNWEGVGVEPDIKKDRKDALDATLKIIQNK